MNNIASCWTVNDVLTTSVAAQLLCGSWAVLCALDVVDDVYKENM